ncbi:cleft lip and palate transmembrane protein 1-domain-containing protein [Limtongia smithiae]|uniref:cleft lip and palate transmembrane protein 1-domain-containing protein n=1 Tax=Limtongia smithiae TaxID=1125753 RepID=UPI0034CF2FEA
MPPRVQRGANGAAVLPGGSLFSWVKSIVTMLGTQYAVSTVTSKVGEKVTGAFSSNSTSNATASVDIEGASATVSTILAEPTEEVYIDPRNLAPTALLPLWPLGTQYDFRLFINDMRHFDDYEAEPFIQVYNLTLGDKTSRVTKSGEIEVTDNIRADGAVYAHAYLSWANYTFIPTSPDYNTTTAYSLHFLLNSYERKRWEPTKKLLLDKSSETDDDAPPSPENWPAASYWHPNITLGVTESESLDIFKIPPALRQWLMADPTNARDAENNAFYYPVLYYDQFWQLRSDMTEINAKTEVLPITVDVVPVPYWKFNTLMNVDYSLRQQAMTNGPGAFESEEVKRALLTNSYFVLALLALVVVLNNVYEMSAFKNTDEYWKSKKEKPALSIFWVLGNVVMKAVTFAYVIGSFSSTSFMLMMAQLSGVLVESWKIFRIVGYKIERRGSWIPFAIRYVDKRNLSDEDKQTLAYSGLAFKSLISYASPLIAAHATYLLLYVPQVSWRYFVITVLAEFVYVYKFFVLAFPVYENYMLKTVPYMPGNTLIFKFLNALLDDILAFLFRTPPLFRLSSLQDDALFVVLLIQMAMYPVDMFRKNEYFQVGVQSVKEKPAGVVFTEQLVVVEKIEGVDGEEEALVAEVTVVDETVEDSEPVTSDE